MGAFRSTTGVTPVHPRQARTRTRIREFTRTGRKGSTKMRMSPEFRTAPLGPLARDRFKKAGMVASLSLVLAAGVVDPAAAAARSMTDQARAAAGNGGDHCKPNHHHK